MAKNNINNNEAWEILLDKYNILDAIDKNGYFTIESKQIKEYREPRLMCSFDTLESRPDILKKHNITIMPNSNRSYILGNFEIYKEFEMIKKSKKIKQLHVPDFETIDIHNITSEASAINTLLLTNGLDDFLGEGETFQTFNGKQTSGVFNYQLNTKFHNTISTTVYKTQMEVDAGFENKNSVIVMEAKNLQNNNFNIRQLYFPFRVWSNRVSKNVRPIFMVYSNMIYRIIEYEFLDPMNISSISYVNEERYSLADVSISLEEIKNIILNTPIVFDDGNLPKSIPFPQADNVNLIIDLLEHLYTVDEELTSTEISEFLNYSTRQGGYYPNAGAYLELMDKKRVGGTYYYSISEIGRIIYESNYKERQFGIIRLMCKHNILNITLNHFLLFGDIMTIFDITKLILELNITESPVTARRRAQTIYSWNNWVLDLLNN